MFLSNPPETREVSEAFASHLQREGYVENHFRLWAWRLDVQAAFARTRRTLLDGSSLTPREVAVIVSAAVSTVGDAYCSFAWAGRLAELTGPEVAEAVIEARESPGLSAREQALAYWVRKVVRSPNATTAEDVGRLRTAGLSDREIFEATSLAAFRAAFATVNDALGAVPDAELVSKLPSELRAAVSYGRQPSSVG